MQRLFNLTHLHLKIIIAVFLIADVCYSFVQHYHAAFDGDMSSIIMPSVSYQHVMNDPFGFSAFLNNEIYAAPNRFFAHYAMSLYFKNVPMWLQHFTSPLNSLYAACAIAKTLIQCALIYLLSVYISGKTKINSMKLLIAATIITPLFHVSGYYIYMGVIDHSITYTFFFALSMVYLLIYFLPFYLTVINNKPLHLSYLKQFALLCLSVVLAFNGPLIPAIILLVCPMLLFLSVLNNYESNKENSFFKNILNAAGKIPRQMIYLFSFLMLLCAYSVFIGFNNAENFGQVISVAERYRNLPAGLFYMFTTKIGFPLILALIFINYYIILKKSNDEIRNRFNMIIIFMLTFCIVYTLLLPLGGYRIYRPNIIRRDTFLPVTLCIFVMFGFSTLQVLKISELKLKRIYISALLIFILIFTLADKPVNENSCEREAILQLASSTNKIVLITNECNIMSWEKIIDYRASAVNAQLLYYLHITPDEKLYYQNP